MFTFGITIVRHGETQYNKDKLLQGQGVDLPLSETGVQQAEAVGHYLRDLKFTNLFASDLQRAKQTADIIVKNNVHCSGMAIVSDPLLKERSFGVAEGRPVDDLKNMAKAAGQSCPSFTPPGGETPEQVKLRIHEFMAALYRRMAADHWRDGESAPAGGTASGAGSGTDGCPCGQPDDGLHGVAAHALVVSHGAYMRLVVRYLVEDLHCSVPHSLRTSHLFSACPNTGVCRFVFTLRRGDGGLAPASIHCVFVNRKDHLKTKEGK
ncbi:probable fructose-2,6-bisphosphatase TIGAR A [Megalops cyprinoides]|uniref:probable fructose-2,6-bisphosphatase TIGAR A n=1 Tax=Megalops cyprinoides TaxID=118141 RepID=UPI00186500A7|nr:probable fructose-2,6-bisphosphatase TIGAR A [Megalops cyprinoides]